MRASLFFMVSALGLASGGCVKSDGPILVVTASYPGADAETVANVIAAPVEQQINGVEALFRMESESGDDGSYLATLRFRSDIDPKVAITLVQNRVQLAEPILPEQSRRLGISVKLRPRELDNKRTAICLIDIEDQGPDVMKRWSEAVKKRLVAESAGGNLEVFPGPDVRKIITRIDRKKCTELGVSEADVREAIRAAGPAASVDARKALKIDSASGQKISLGSVAAFSETTVAPAIFRVNLRIAVRISGLPPEGKTPSQAAVSWVKLAGPEVPKGIVVENLTEK
jgi:multidrug efflux pump subunit AcrB